MDIKDLLYGIQENIDDVIAHKGSEGEKLWHNLLDTHPVDIAEIFYVDSIFGCVCTRDQRQIRESRIESTDATSTPIGGVRRGMIQVIAGN